MRIRRTASPWSRLLLWLLVWALAPGLGACGRKSRSKKSSKAPATGTKEHATRGKLPLARWLRQVPADARWALASTDLHRLQRVLSRAAALLSHHKELSGELLRWRTRAERSWSTWPLDPASWKRLGLPPSGGGALYRRADGVLVALFDTQGPRGLPRTLQAIQQAIQRRGAHPTGSVKPLRLGGQPAYRLGGWTCATRGRISTCAQVAPKGFAKVIRPVEKSLWKGPLGKLPPRYLQARVGVWLRPEPGAELGPARTLQRMLVGLLSTPARGFWLALSLHRRLQLRAAALIPGPGDAKPWASLPRPGRSGLAAGRDAPLVVRLRLGPRPLGDLIRRLMPTLAPVVELFRGRPGSGETLAEEMLNGEVVLISDHTGVAGILGLRSRTRGQRAMKQLMLLLAPRLTGWQKQVRARGRGWDLTYTRANLGDLPTHRLTLQVPPKAGPGAPTVPRGRLTLLWAIAHRHLLVATDANVLRRLVARVEQPDTGFLEKLGDGAGRQGFREHRALAVRLRPRDPLYALSPSQRAAARQWIEGLSPEARRWTTWIRALVDLTGDATLSCEPLDAGLGCHLGLTLLTRPGPGPESRPRPRPHLDLDARYREALIKKWGGNETGYLSGLGVLAASPTASAVRAKANRVLAYRRGVPTAGLEGLLLSAWLPWERQRRATAAREEAPRELDRLARALRQLASRARALPPKQRRRWHRGLRSTKITPIRTCCAGGVRRCQSRAADWRHPTWRRLGFQLEGAHRYRYQLLWEPGPMRHRAILRALGDYDCNGRSSLQQRVVTIDAATGKLTVGPLTRVRADD